MKWNLSLNQFLPPTWEKIVHNNTAAYPYFYALKINDKLSVHHPNPDLASMIELTVTNLCVHLPIPLAYNNRQQIVMCIYIYYITSSFKKYWRLTWQFRSFRWKGKKSLYLVLWMFQGHLNFYKTLHCVQFWILIIKHGKRNNTDEWVHCSQPSR